MCFHRGAKVEVTCPLPESVIQDYQFARTSGKEYCVSQMWESMLDRRPRNTETFLAHLKCTSQNSRLNTEPLLRINLPFSARMVKNSLKCPFCATRWKEGGDVEILTCTKCNLQHCTCCNVLGDDPTLIGVFVVNECPPCQYQITSGRCNLATFKFLQHMYYETPPKTTSKW